MTDVFPPPTLPPKTTVDVWRIELDSDLNHDPGVNLDSILSAEERARAERFIFSRDASRFRLCRAMLRIGLAWYLQKPPMEIALTTKGRGKPCLAEPSSLHFNVSHSDGLGLIAFTTAGEVGIDVEATQRDFQVLDIAAANFTRNEEAIIAAAQTQQEQADIFLQFWTRKEAVLKAAGCGILRGLNTVDVSQPFSNLVRLSGQPDGISESCWVVRDLELTNGFAGAVAAAPGDWSIQLWQMRCDGAKNRIIERFQGVL